MTLKDDWTDGEIVRASDINSIASSINNLGTLFATDVQTEDYSASSGQLIPCNTSSGGFYVDLPTEQQDGSRIAVQKIDSSVNSVTVRCTGSDRFNIKPGGDSSFAIGSSGQAATFQYSLSAGVWYIVSGTANVDLGNVSLYSPLVGSSTISNSTAPTVGQMNFYNASNGAITGIVLPALSGLDVGARMAIKKVDSSPNTVTFVRSGTNTFYSSTETTITLRLQGEQRELQVISVSGTKYWSYVSDTTPVASLDSRYVAKDSAGKLAISSINASGAASSTTFLRGDGVWAGSNLEPTDLKTSNYTAAVGNIVPCDASVSGPFTVTLPSAPTNGSQICVKKIDSSANVITVSRGGADVFNKSGGVTSVSLKYQNQAVTLQYASGVWHILSSLSEAIQSANIADATALGKSLVTATSTAAARKALSLPVFDARDYGVIADGQPHNNVANLLDAMAALEAAGGGTLLLPAGTISTSDAKLGIVTANSGNTYENNSGIPVPHRSIPVHITGHGQGVTTLRLSPGFTSAFLFRRDFSVSDGQRWRDITIERMTIDRINLKNTDLGPKIVITQTQQLWGGVWAQVPDVPDLLYKNVRAVWVTSAANGSMPAFIWPPATPGTGLQLLPLWGSLLLQPGDTVEPLLYDSIIGCGYVGGMFANGWDFRIDRVAIRDIDIINVYTKPTVGGFAFGPQTTPCIDLGVAKDPNTPKTFVPSLTNVLVERVRMYGGNTGVSLTGGAGAWVDNVWCVDCFHDTMSDPQTMHYSSNFIFGGSAYLHRAGIVRCTGKRSGDVGLEVDSAWDFHEIDCTWEDTCNTNVFLANYSIPARKPTGPEKTTLAAALSNSATTITVASMPDNVEKNGIAHIEAWGNSKAEIVGYSANGNTLTLWRGLNGTASVAHDSGVDFIFVETAKTRFRSINQTIRNNGINTVAGNGRAWVWYSSLTPQIPISMINPTWQFDGNPRSWYYGAGIYAGGWFLELDIQGLRYTQTNITPQASSTLMSAICLDWEKAHQTYATGAPIPTPRIHGKNNVFSIDGDVTRVYTTTISTVSETVNTSNIVPDGGFENLAWDYYTLTTEQTHSGAKSLKVTGTGDYVYIQFSYPWMTKYPVVEGKQYYGEVWVRSKAGNVGGGGLDWFLVAKDSFGLNPDKRLFFVSAAANPSSTGWTKLSGVVVIPPGYDSVIPAVTLLQNPAGDVIYFDDVVVQRPSSPTNIATFGGFEESSWMNTWMTTEQAHSGAKSMKVVVDDAFLYRQMTVPFDAKMSVITGLTYTADMWVYPKSSNTGGGNIQLRATVSDSSGARPDATIVFFTTATPTKGTWTKLSGTVTIPYGYDGILPALQLFPGVVNDVLYIDDFSIVPSAETVQVATVTSAANSNAGTPSVAVIRPRSGSWAKWDFEFDASINVNGIGSGKVSFVDLRPTATLSGEWPTPTVGSSVIAALSKIAISAKTSADAPVALKVGPAPSGGTAGLVIAGKLLADIDRYGLPSNGTIDIDSGQTSSVKLTVNGDAQ